MLKQKSNHFIVQRLALLKASTWLELSNNV